MTGSRFRQDDEHLAHHLRAIDPAHGVDPLPEHRIEDIIMNITTEEPAEVTPEATRAPGRPRRLPVVAALVTAAAAAAIVTSAIVTQSSPGETLALEQPEPGIFAMCAPITAEFIADTDVAFEGRVSGIEGATVTLEVLQQFTGEPVSTVTVPQGTSELIELTTERFEIGGAYLISAVDGVVTTCGISGSSTPELKALYEKAFS